MVDSLTTSSGAYSAAIPYTQTQAGYSLPYTQSVYDTGTAGETAYTDLLGFTGTGSTDAYKKIPGVQAAIDAGTQAANRTSAAGGQLASGNALDAATQKAVDYASKYYLDYAKLFQPFITQKTTGAEDTASIYGNLGKDVSNLYTGGAKTATGIYSDLSKLGWSYGGSKSNLDYGSAVADTKAGNELVGGALKAGTTAIPGSSIFGAVLGT